MINEINFDNITEEVKIIKKIFDNKNKNIYDIFLIPAIAYLTSSILLLNNLSFEGGMLYFVALWGSLIPLVLSAYFMDSSFFFLKDKFSAKLNNNSFLKYRELKKSTSKLSSNSKKVLNHIYNRKDNLKEIDILFIYLDCILNHEDFKILEDNKNEILNFINDKFINTQTELLKEILITKLLNNYEKDKLLTEKNFLFENIESIICKEKKEKLYEVYLSRMDLLKNQDKNILNSKKEIEKSYLLFEKKEMEIKESMIKTI